MQSQRVHQEKVSRL